MDFLDENHLLQEKDPQRMMLKPDLSTLFTYISYFKHISVKMNPPLQRQKQTSITKYLI